MKKILFVAVACICALMAQAGEYAYLVFTDNLGNQMAIPTANLTMTISNGELKATMGDDLATFILADLQSMQFSKSASLEGLEEILEADKPIDVYTPLGARVGRFNSLLEAARNIGQGTYVITNGKNSQTIILQ